MKRHFPWLCLVAFVIILPSFPTAATAIGERPKIAAGSTHTLAIHKDGSLWAWGRNYIGELGLGTFDYDPHYRPTRVGVANDWVAVAAGVDFSLAVKADGTLWAWGRNDNGQLGLGTADSDPHPTPAQVGNDSNWFVAYAGYFHSLAQKKITKDLCAWGYNDFGQLGVGDTAERHSPTPVLVPGSTYLFFENIACGGYHNLGTKYDGSLWAWGYNYWGQLGLGGYDLISHPTPAQVFTSYYYIIAAGGWHSLAMSSPTADYELYAWGLNEWGQLGVGNYTTLRYPTPTQVETDKGWSFFAAGSHHTLGIKADGSLWAWGDNYYGELGLGQALTGQYIPTPTRVGSDTDWVAVAAGDQNSLMLKADGSLWACGYNDYGKLGLGDTNNRHSPTRVWPLPNPGLTLLLLE
jgi:alpha-tubulin suppressor-like RCC1 family protein